MKDRKREISYISFPSANRQPFPPSMLASWKLFIFTDAGFGTLLQNHSVESHVVILGDVVERGGVGKCHGLMLDHRCAKIRRVCRCAFSADAHGTVTAVDAALWLQLIPTEISTRNFDYKRLTPPNEFPSINPFRESPWNKAVKREALLSKIHSALLSSHSANPMITAQSQTFQTTCKRRGAPMKIDVITTHDLNPIGKQIFDASVTNYPDILLHPMVLTDCCSLYGAILRLQQKTTERSARITLAFLRDALKLVVFSFADATVDLGDVGAKHAESLGIIDHFPKTRRFALSFVGREERR